MHEQKELVSIHMSISFASINCFIRETCVKRAWNVRETNLNFLSFFDLGWCLKESDIKRSITSLLPKQIRSERLSSRPWLGFLSLAANPSLIRAVTNSCGPHWWTASAWPRRSAALKIHLSIPWPGLISKRTCKLRKEWIISALFSMILSISWVNT